MQSWTSNSSDTSVTVSGLSLTEGETYTFSARATDTDNQLSDTTTTDGLKVDVTSPVVSSIIEGSATPLNYSLSFDGDGDYVSVADPDDGSLDFGTENMTFSVWFKVDEIGATGVYLFRKIYSGSSAAYGLYLMPNGTLQAFIGSQSSVSGGSIVAGQWYHVLTRRSSGTIIIYINGSYVGAVNHSSTASSSEALEFGQDFSGHINELAIWRTALSNQAITQIYSGQNPLIDSENYDASSDLDGYWNFNDCNGTSLADLSGNGMMYRKQAQAAVMPTTRTTPMP